MIVANDNASTTVKHKGIMACTARIVELMKDDPELEKLALPAEEQPQPVSV